MVAYYLSDMELKVYINPELPAATTAGTLSEHTNRAFRKLVYAFFHKHGRSFPWRSTTNPYHILVSEIMLQQTQVERVAGKYDAFVKRFPDLHSLNNAAFEEVLGLWKGLGYNRRCIALKRCAEIIVSAYGGVVPNSLDALVKLPGVGPTTAAGICCFAYGQPALYLETNVRTLFIHFFFPGRDGIHDREILPLLDQTVDRNNPRTWYFALMDYGAMLKREVGNLSKKSRHYAKQPPFEGSDRQLRGRILEMLLSHRNVTVDRISVSLKEHPERVARIIRSLEQEGFVTGKDTIYTLSEQPSKQSPIL